MALVLADRVQQTGTANTTVSFTLSGSVTGFQSFAVVGNGNTTYYSALDGSGNWEVGLGTYATGGTLTRTTILSSSNSGSAVTFSGTVNVILTYPSGKSVNLNASGNVSALGTVSSGTWNGSTIPVAYGGTGVTTSTGSGSTVLSTSPTLVTPALGTPSSGTLTNCTFPTLNQNTTGSSGSCTGNAATATTATLANGVNQYPNRTDSAWYQAVWSNAAGGDKNIYSSSTVNIYSGNYGYVGFNGSAWYIGGNASYGLYSNTGLYVQSAVWSPIFYDANDSGYYCDPTGRSNLSQATFPNGFQFSGRFCFNGSGSNLDNSTGMWFEENYGIYAVGASTLWNFTTNNSVLAGFTGGGGYYGNGNGYFTGGVNQYYSDERLKTKIKTIDSALEKVLSLDGFIYVENEVARSLGYTNEKEQVGVSAQKVQKVLPQAVSLAPCDMQGVPETGEIVSKSGENYLTVDYSRLVPLLIEAIKEQQTQIDELKAQILKGK